MNENYYVHGYSKLESSRLQDQAVTLTELLHHDTLYPPGHKILEAGCGIGAQTITLAKKSPDAFFTSIDISEASLNDARELIKRNKIRNVQFQVANLFNMPFEPESFDHIFLCFVLEHLPNPLAALKCLMKVLKKGGSLTVIEGDHDSAFYHPKSQYAQKTIDCLIHLQEQMGGNSLIGRELYPLLNKTGFKNVIVNPRFVYADDSLPEMVDGFTRKTFIAMIEGVKEKALSSNLLDEKTWNKGIEDLNKTAEGEGTFCYTFFKATAIK
ncbi:MAG: methyltransferase domain-containing protein [Bacteroidales bacterium]|nr:methyltransferase domain-containing protein [Bacteroidales bacterium]